MRILTRLVAASDFNSRNEDKISRECNNPFLHLSSRGCAILGQDHERWLDCVLFVTSHGLYLRHESHGGFFIPYSDILGYEQLATNSLKSRLVLHVFDADGVYDSLTDFDITFEPASVDASSLVEAIGRAITLSFGGAYGAKMFGSSGFVMKPIDTPELDHDLLPRKRSGDILVGVEKWRRHIY